MKKPIYFGEEVKTGDDGKIFGYVVRYGNPMLTDSTKNRDFFTDETDFDLFGDDKKSMLHEHGMSPLYGGRTIGAMTLIKKSDGIWGEGYLSPDLPHRDEVMADVKAGKYGFSSGSQGYRVERLAQPNSSNFIKRWPIGEVSLTKNPAETRARAHCVKSLVIPEYYDPNEIKSYASLSVSDYDWESGTDTSMQHSVHAEDATMLYDRLAELQNVMALMLSAVRDATPAAKSLAMEAYTKMGAKLSGKNKSNLQAAHDSIVAVHPDACPSNSTKSNNSILDAELLNRLTDMQIQLRDRDSEIKSLKEAAALATTVVTEPEATTELDALKTLVAEKEAEIATLVAELDATKSAKALLEAAAKADLSDLLKPRGAVKRK